MINRLNPPLRLFWIIVFASSSACDSPRNNAIEDNKSLVRRWIEEGFNKRNLNVVNEVFADQFSIHSQVIGPAGVRASMGRFLNAFPDLHVNIDRVVAEKNHVAMSYTATGTQRAEFEKIPPTGTRVKWSGMDFFTIKDGRISEADFLSDEIGLLSQLGATMSLPQRARPDQPSK